MKLLGAIYLKTFCDMGYVKKKEEKKKNLFAIENEPVISWNYFYSERRVYSKLNKKPQLI